MILEHVAIAVYDKSEIENFYLKILGMREIKSFILDKVLSRDIFGIEKETVVYQLRKDSLVLEIFLTPDMHEPGYKHICISTGNREEIVKKATRHSYKCLRLEREKPDLIFITDNSGNIFEVQQRDEV